MEIDPILKQVLNLSPEDINQIIGKFAGWKYEEIFEDSFSLPRKQVSRGFKWKSPNGHITKLPNYTESSDECKEAVLLITDKIKQLEFSENLAILLNHKNRDKYRWMGPTAFHYITVDSDTFAQAIVLTILGNSSCI